MKELFYSTKFRTAVIATVIGICAKFGLHLDPETVGLLMSPFIVYIAGHAYVDRGVSVANIQAATGQKSLELAQQQLAVSVTQLPKAQKEEAEQILATPTEAKVE